MEEKNIGLIYHVKVRKGVRETTYRVNVLEGKKGRGNPLGAINRLVLDKRMKINRRNIVGKPKVVGKW